MTFATVVDDLNAYSAQLAQVKLALGQMEEAAKANILQQFFAQTLWPQLSQTDMLEQPQGRAAITEIHRHMRLLMVEVNFVTSASHGDIRQQRLQQMEQRLQQLEGFTQVLINLCNQ
ncbi:heterocyst frequency control protein PatD [Leptothoe sp. ISB3NOV94-8A]